MLEFKMYAVFLIVSGGWSLAMLWPVISGQKSSANGEPLTFKGVHWGILIGSSMMVGGLAALVYGIFAGEMPKYSPRNAGDMRDEEMWEDARPDRIR